MATMQDNKSTLKDKNTHCAPFDAIVCEWDHEVL